MKNSIEIKKELVSMHKAGRVPHSSIFVGPMGFGSLDLAINLAEIILCSDKTIDEPCNECASCKKVKKLIHPDLYFTFPVIKKDNKRREDTTSNDFLPEWREFLIENRYGNKEDWANKIQADNKQLNINKTECNEIIKKLGLMSFEGASKVLIIYLAESLAREGNRLLKLIEEPPTDTFIILVTKSQDAILNTILSRCQIFKVGPFPDEYIKDQLTGQNVESGRLEDICFISNGDLRKAMVLSIGEKEDYSENLLSWLRLAYQLNKQPKPLIQWIEKFAKMSKTWQNSFLEYLQHFLREFQLSLLTGNQDLRLSPEEKISVEKLKKIIDLEKVEKLSQICDTLYYNLSRNVNSKIELMNASIEVNTLLHQKLVLSQ